MESRGSILDPKDVTMHKGIAFAHGEQVALLLHERYAKQAGDFFEWINTIEYSQYRMYDIWQYAKPLYRESKKADAQQSALATSTDATTTTNTARRGGEEITDDDYSASLYSLLALGVLLYPSEKWKEALKLMVSKCHSHYPGEVFSMMGFQAQRPKTRLTLSQSDNESGILYDGRVSPIDGFISVGIVESKGKEDLSKNAMTIATGLLHSSQTIKTMYGISDDDIWYILTNSIARRISFLGSTYYFEMKKPASPELAVGRIIITAIQSGTDRKPCVDILSSYVQALRDLIENPGLMQIDPPFESRLPDNIHVRAYLAVNDGLAPALAKLLSGGCVSVITIHPGSGFTAPMIEWIEKRKGLGKPKIVKAAAAGKTEEKMSEMPAANKAEEKMAMEVLPQQLDALKKSKKPTGGPLATFYSVEELNPDKHISYVYKSWHGDAPPQEVFRNGVDKNVYTMDTRFRIGSIGKIIGAATVLTLEEKGLLSIDEPIEKYAPFRFTDRRGEKITLAMLLNHTSGIGHPSPLPFRPGWVMPKPVSGSTMFGSVMKPFFDGPLAADPPTKEQHYDGYAFVLLRYAIEKVTGLSWLEAIKKFILQPFGMTRTGTEADTPFYVIDTAQVGIEKASDSPSKRKIAISSDPYEKYVPELLCFAGGMCSTANDLHKLSIGLLTIMKPSTWKKMTAAKMPDIKPGVKYAYGINVIDSDTKHAEKYYTHGGSIDGCTSKLIFSKDRGSVFLSNISGLRTKG